MKKQISLSLESNIYEEAKEMLPAGQISPLVNDFLSDYLKKKKRERLIAGYKKTAKSEAMRTEDKV
jgi:hypothetical protein